LDQPVNNRKIAQHIRKDLEPKQVKHVKGRYIRNLKQRIENGVAVNSWVSIPTKKSLSKGTYKTSALSDLQRPSSPSAVRN
jgi:hypothetical protein